MTNQFSQIKWVRVLLTALVVNIVGFLTVFLVVTAYASYLGFQARGAPDLGLIETFAAQYAPWIGSISLVLFTFLGGMHIGRRVQAALPLHGILLGVVISLLNLVFGGSLDLSVLVTAVLTIGAGWLGGMLAVRR